MHLSPEAACEADEFEALWLTLRGEEAGDDLIMHFSAFVDESGSSDEPTLVLAGLISDLDGWMALKLEWQQILRLYGAPYAHYTELRHGYGPFRDWTHEKRGNFVTSCFNAWSRHCKAGISVHLKKTLYEEVYRQDFPKGCSPDSAYAICAAEIFGGAMQIARECLHHDGKINFVFEQGHANAPNALRLHQDFTKYAENREALGPLTFMERAHAEGLQAADHLAHATRVCSGEALSIGAMIARSGDTETGGCRLFPREITAEALLWRKGQALALRSQRRREKAKAKRAEAR